MLPAGVGAAHRDAALVGVADDEFPFEPGVLFTLQHFSDGQARPGAVRVSDSAGQGLADGERGASGPSPLRHAGSRCGDPLRGVGGVRDFGSGAGTRQGGAPSVQQSPRRLGNLGRDFGFVDRFAVALVRFRRRRQRFVLVRFTEFVVVPVLRGGQFCEELRLLREPPVQRPWPPLVVEHGQVEPLEVGERGVVDTGLL